MEIKIAVCEDKEEQSQYIKFIAGRWAEENRLQIQAEMFGSAENLKLEIAGGKKYDILLLDIEMGGQSGVELARELRLSGDNAAIIFITALADHISEGYDVSALHYLLKPIKEDKFYEVLTKAYKNMTESKRFLIVNSNGKDHRISFDDIIYIEALRNLVAVKTIDNRYEVRQNIGKIEQELDNSFFRCQRSYIVMLKHIKYISKTEVLLDSGETISLGRNIYKELYKAFINYFKGERGADQWA
ncbi:MAG: LytTR family DNA-binding domain-containing protein [Oscillospiraceae bacterium]|nr:LytTR family DNA-binding domain-containing protein [Oscillospiraceae bacterium]